MKRLLLVITLCMSILAVAASGCGGGSGTSYSGTKPDTWAAGVCSALSDWAQGMQSDSQALSGGKRDIASVKAKFIAFLNQSVQRSDTMLSKVNATGPPAIKNGAALQLDLVAVLKRARASFASAVPRAQAFPTTDAATFSRKVLELSAGVQKELTAIGQTFNKLGDKYKDKALSQSTSKDPACQKLSRKGKA